MIPPPVELDRQIDIDAVYAVCDAPLVLPAVPGLIRLLAESRAEVERLRGKIAELADEPDVDPVTRLWATGFRAK